MRTPLRLPALLAEIAAATDVEAALAIARAHGGTTVFIPARPRDGHWLVELLGRPRAEALARALVPPGGGMKMLIPLGPQRTGQRWRDMREMIDKGCSEREIARAIGVHERTVRYHRARAFKSVEAHLAQLDLFPSPTTPDEVRGEVLPPRAA